MPWTPLLHVTLKYFHCIEFSLETKDVFHSKEKIEVYFSLLGFLCQTGKATQGYKETIIIQTRARTVLSALFDR